MKVTVVLGLLVAVLAAVVAVLAFRSAPLLIAETNGEEAIVYRSLGGPLEVARVVPKDKDLASSVLAPFDVEVSMRFIGVNPADYKVLSIPFWCHPRGGSVCGFGLEGSGVVERIGSQVSRVQVGDRVMVNYYSVAAQHARAPENNIVRLPSNYSFEDGASISLAVQTAAEALLDICPGSGETILIAGGGSVCGRAGIEIARGRFKRVIVTCGPKSKKDCLASGATDVIDYTKESLQEGLQRLGISKVDVAYEAVSTPELYDSAKVRGAKCIASIDTGSENILLGLVQMIWRSVRPFITRDGSKYRFFLKRTDSGTMDRVLELIAAKRVPFFEKHIFNWTTGGVQDALEHVKRGRGGKALIKVSA